MSRKLQLVGQKFGKLTVKEFVEFKDKRSWWLCICDCGNQKIMSSKNLLTNKVKSCGCLKDKGMNRGDVVEGACGDRLYKVYKSMIHRCYYPSTNSYKRYGGRGITVCSEWFNSFEKFKEWALLNGYDYNAPKGQCTLDRIDNDGNYEPSNCRWITIKEQLNNNSRNVLITANGETHNLQQWADILGTTHNALENRYRRGWSDERIINTPIRKYRKVG